MNLIPIPKKLEKKDGSFFLSYRSRIVISKDIGENGPLYASLLKESIATWAGYTLTAVKGKPEVGEIFLRIEKTLEPQEYRIFVREDGITAEGGDGAGVLYAVETLCQIIEQCGGALPCMEIQDAPDMKHRGYYLDETRGRVMKLDYLKRVVDRLCRYKINEFQLYVEHTYLFSGLSEMWRDETPLTAEEIMELDAYCRGRHVELIPSLASFGHLYMLLSTKTHGELCELEDSWKQPFSFWDRMQHHTVNVSDERVLPLIKGMLEEYMALFSSDKFNLCADETFDLGKGKAKKLADARGVHRIYIDYLKELCNFLVENGKTPMFWGDVICGEPELVKELPEEIICLTWGYAPDQREDESRKMAATGIKQYLCPGVAGWNQWMNLLEASYRNIVLMCGYAKKHGAIGILNTDWGDFGHVNHPEYSVPGMIYGAAFSWNANVVPFEEINRQIARVEYHDASGQLVNFLAKIPEDSRMTWWHAVMYYEIKELGGSADLLPDLSALCDGDKVRAANGRLEELGKQLRSTVVCMDSRARVQIQLYDIAIEGIMIWNEVGGAVAQQREDFALAERLEAWFMAYKVLWRETSREGDLPHVAEIVFWYADLLRGRERKRRRDASC